MSDRVGRTIADKPRDPRIVYRECQEIMRHYIALIADAYARSVCSYVTKDGGFVKVVYPPEVEAHAETIRAHMNAAVNAHLKTSGYETEEPTNG